MFDWWETDLVILGHYVGGDGTLPLITLYHSPGNHSLGTYCLSLNTQQVTAVPTGGWELEQEGPGGGCPRAGLRAPARGVPLNSPCSCRKSVS